MLLYQVHRGCTAELRLSSCKNGNPSGELTADFDTLLFTCQVHSGTSLSLAKNIPQRGKIYSWKNHKWTNPALTPFLHYSQGLFGSAI